MSGKYDPPDKPKLLVKFRRTPSTVEVAVAAAEAQHPQKQNHRDGASRASSMENSKSLAHAQARAMEPQSNRRGRKRVVTRERVNLICEMIATGSTERAALLRAGIGSTAFSAAKRNDAELRARIAAARDEWARLRHQRHAAALFESQTFRSANRKALRPQPTRQAKAVANYLIVRVPLNYAAIPDEEIVRACELYRLPFETWVRQSKAFALMQKVYAKRAAIRGERPVQPETVHRRWETAEIESDAEWEL